jgi:hypothetical protein
MKYVAFIAALVAAAPALAQQPQQPSQQPPQDRSMTGGRAFDQPPASAARPASPQSDDLRALGAGPVDSNAKPESIPTEPVGPTVEDGKVPAATSPTQPAPAPHRR